ncbi:MAG TPA: hypothetical protein VK166_08725 [Chitinophagaceae bacterium]|nr:hypothetical protein [Chitinophagaceae bacterium]
MKVNQLLRVKASFNFRFVSLLAVIILIQQLSFAAHLPFFSGSISPASLHYSDKSSGQSGSSHVSIDVDVEVLNEDDAHDFQGHPERALTADYVIARWLYTSLVNNHYRRLARAVHHQADPPLFILHHSWKAHLS